MLRKVDIAHAVLRTWFKSSKTTNYGRENQPSHIYKQQNNQPIKNNNTMEMAKYIMQIFRTQTMIVMSWGFNSPKAINNGLRFFVQGFLHKGAVEVIYNEGRDLFEVRTINKDGSIKEVSEDVYFDCLVNVIDGLVERCSNYHERVKETYGF